MSKKLVSGIFYTCFGLGFAFMLGIMIIGFINQTKDEKEQAARYEQMITEGSKMTLTNDILEEDHTKYLEDSAKAKRTFATLLVCFGAMFVMFILMGIYSTVIRFIEDGQNGYFVIYLASFACLVFIFVSAVIIATKVVIPKMISSNPEKEAYFFSELNLSDSERKEELVETGSGEDRRTETRVTYFLIEENGNKIEVNKLFFDRFEDPGTYYAGQTVRGNIFSLYSGKYFELAE